MSADMYNQSVFLVAKAAYMYYIQNIPQQEIAEELKISITTVSRLLKRAKNEHIVEFVIRDPYVKCLELEKEIKETFGLKEVIIAPTVEGNYGGDIVDPENIKKLVALEGARYLQRIIKKDDILGITWGSTIYHMINYLNPAQKVDATFVTLHGSLTSIGGEEWEVRTLVSRISRAFFGKNYILPTETLMSSPKTVQLLRQERNVRKVYDMYNKINISIAGIGALYPELNSILARGDFMTADELKMLQSKNVVGDIALHFIDREGRECDTPLKDRTLSIDFNIYRKIPTKVVIASDPIKAFAILSALKGHLIDVLIIDHHLARAILNLKSKTDSEE